MPLLPILFTMQSRFARWNPKQFAQRGQISTADFPSALFVNNILPEKTIVLWGENHFLAMPFAKCLRTGIRPAKKFHHKVQPQALTRPV
jgi:hypothetical protein